MNDLSSLSDAELVQLYERKTKPFDAALADEGVDGPLAGIVRSIYAQESSSGANTKTSNAGAVGGMQVIPATFKSVADAGWDNSDPYHNARAGIRYARQMYEKAEGDPVLTAAGYYGGPGGLEKARSGVAVSDPRNPKAPNTLEYGKQVADRAAKAGAAPAVSTTSNPLTELTDEELLAAYEKAKGTAKAPAQPKRGALEETVRQGGLTVRGALTGAAAVPGIVVDAITGPINAAADFVAGKGNGPRIPTTAAAVGNLLTAVGVPQPENATERVVQDVVGGMSGAGAFVKTGQVLANSARPVAAAVGEKLAAGPGLQVASGAGAGGASGTVREQGGGAGAQVAAGVAGALAPGGLPYARGAALRAALRGGEAGRVKAADNLATFQAAGVEPTVGQVTGGRVAQATESMLAKTPGSAGVIARYAQKQADDMQASVQKLAADLSPGADATTAGEAIVRGVGAFKTGMKLHQRELYNKLDEFIPADSRIPAERTQAALASLNEEIPGAPALSQWFKNARIQGIEIGLKSDTGGVAAVLTRPGMQRAATNMRKALEADAAKISAANSERRALGMSNMEPVPTAAQIEDRIQGFLRENVDNKITYEALKKLRTLVGQEISDGGLMADVPRSKWSSLYGALSDDLGDAAKVAGPQAEQSWQWANTYTKSMLGRLEELKGIVGRDAPEKVFSAVLTGTSEGTTVARRIMNALPKAERREVASAVVQRLGRATPGQQSALGDEFSSETFLSNLAKMSAAARHTIFGRTNIPDIQQRIGELAKVAETRREGGRVFANPSGTAGGTAQIAVGGGIGGAAATTLLTGNPVPLAMALSVPALANGAGRLMTNRGFVNAAATATPIKAGTEAAAVQAAARSPAGQERDRMVARRAPPRVEDQPTTPTVPTAPVQPTVEESPDVGPSPDLRAVLPTGDLGGAADPGAGMDGGAGDGPAAPPMDAGGTTAQSTAEVVPLEPAQPAAVAPQIASQAMSDGTLLLKGDMQYVLAVLTALGVPANSMMRWPGGVRVGRSVATAVQQALEGKGL